MSEYGTIAHRPLVERGTSVLNKVSALSNHLKENSLHEMESFI